MVRKLTISIDMIHGDEKLIDKILRLRYPDYPEDDTPKASYNIISKYLKVPYKTIHQLLKKFR